MPSKELREFRRHQRRTSRSSQPAHGNSVRNAKGVDMQLAFADAI